LPDRDAFWEDYARVARPVVVTDLFRGEAIREVHTLAQASALWGEVELRFRGEYLEAFLARSGLAAAPAAQERRMRLREYLAGAELDASPARSASSPAGSDAGALLCSEEPVPPEIAARFSVPEVAGAADDPPVTQLFLGRRGQHAHL